MTQRLSEEVLLRVLGVSEIYVSTVYDQGQKINLVESLAYEVFQRRGQAGEFVGSVPHDDQRCESTHLGRRCRRPKHRVGIHRMEKA